ncbi:MAG: aldo/keto reductase [Caldilineaceae bacterium]
MNYVTLGSTGVQVSQLCFGVMSFGGDADEATSAAMYRRTRDAGINFYDCANVYQRGRAEEILGKLMADERDELVITTKVGSRMRDGVNGDGLSRRHIMREAEDSLRRLGTDRIDLYFLHRFDNAVPMEETLRALDDLVTQGKVLYPAVSNWAAWQIAKSLGVSTQEGLASFACIQPMYNLTKRQAEVEILPLAQAEGLGVFRTARWAAVCWGNTAQRRARQRSPHGQRHVCQALRCGVADYEVAERFTEYAKEKDIHPATLAVAWVGAHPGVTASSSVRATWANWKRRWPRPT